MQDVQCGDLKRLKSVLFKSQPYIKPLTNNSCSTFCQLQTTFSSSRQPHIPVTSPHILVHSTADSMFKIHIPLVK